MPGGVAGVQPMMAAPYADGEPAPTAGFLPQTIEAKKTGVCRFF